MLKITNKPSKNPASAVTFETPTIAQKQGIEMLIALNMSKKSVLTGPDVNLDKKILVIKDKPHFFFNPEIDVPESVTTDPKDSIITVRYKDYQGHDKRLELLDPDNTIKRAIDYLNNGAVAKKKAKKKLAKKES